MIATPTMTGLGALPSALVLFDGGAVVEANDAACRELGRSRDALLDGELMRSLSAEDRLRLEEALARVGEGDESLDPAVELVSVRRTDASGRIEQFDLRLSRGPSGTFADIRDVTERTRLERMLGCLSDATLLIDTESRVLWRSSGFFEMMGMAADEAFTTSIIERIHPEDMPRLMQFYADALDKPGERQTVVVGLQVGNETKGWLHSRLTAVNMLDDPMLGGILFRSEHQSEADTVESIARTSGGFRSLAESAPIGILVLGRYGHLRGGRPTYLNRPGRLLLGLTEDQPLAEWASRLRPDSRAAVDALLADGLEHQVAGSTLVAVEAGPDGVTWLRVDVLPQVDERDQPFGLIATLQDVTAEILTREELVESKDELWRLANHDALTGLPNRAFLMDRLTRALARQKRSGAAVALLYCDLDGFKAVNDSLGHLAGDAVLVEAARRLENVVRETDTVSRFGGDEFLVICEGFTAPAQVEAVADRVLETLALPMEVAGTKVEVGVSIGIVISEPGTELTELIRMADQTMYGAKAAGKARRHVARTRPANNDDPEG
jgi:diguanylate cyclase (GGDEF)-like protein